MSEWCPTHKTYSAKKEPNSLCGRCYELWHLRCPERKANQNVWTDEDMDKIEKLARKKLKAKG